MRSWSSMMVAPIIPAMSWSGLRPVMSMCDLSISAANSAQEFDALISKMRIALFRNTREAFLDHERAKSELKALMPEDAKECIGHGVRAKRSSSGAVSFDVLEGEVSHAPI